MLIALDYDGTYTLQPEFWDSFIVAVKSAGNEIVCATMRHESEPIEMNCRIIYTGRQAKAKFLESIGLKPNVWIDDNPIWLYRDSH